MSEPVDDERKPAAGVPFRLWDHVGMISGAVLGVIVLGFLVVLAAAGDPAALAVIVVVVAGVALVYFGGRLHGLRGRS